jgi:superfamily II DNA or RNA helicase
VRAAVDALWAAAADLTAPRIEDYARRVRQAPRLLPAGEADEEPLEPPPAPHESQQEALAALGSARKQRRRRALVVLATGLGKTWLAAHDVAQVARETGRFPRVLFLAHRHLAQADATFRRLLSAEIQASQVGWCAGDLLEPEPLVVVASIQKLARPEHLQRVLATPPDYLIVDEVHHADAPTYRRVLDALDPAFLLGSRPPPTAPTTATCIALFDDFIAYRADLGAGIAASPAAASCPSPTTACATT